MSLFFMELGKLPTGQTIPMILHCPDCGERHIDEQDFAEVAHHTHACQGCGLVWRPAKVNTHGVRFLGFNSFIDHITTTAALDALWGAATVQVIDPRPQLPGYKNEAQP